ERIRHADDVENHLARQAAVARSDGRLRDADACGDRPERLPPVALQRLDYLAVDVINPEERRNRPTLLTPRPVRFLPLLHALLQSGRASTTLCAAIDAVALPAYSAVVPFPGERRLGQMTVPASSSVSLT